MTRPTIFRHVTTTRTGGAVTQVKPVTQHFLLRLLLGATTILASADDARAFCRTLTEEPPETWSGNSPSCFAGSPDAKVVYFRNHCVGYALQKDASRYVPLDQARRIVKEAFDAWSNANCGDGQRPSIQFVDQGPVECNETGFNEHSPNQNLIVFRDDDWPGGAADTTLAETRVTVNNVTGEIYDVDMEINTARFKIVADPQGPDEYSLRAIVQHEVGHFLGLAHSQKSDALMHYRYDSTKAQLSADDTAGVCSIYHPAGMRSTSRGSIREAQCDATPLHGFSSQCAPPTALHAKPDPRRCSVSSKGLDNSGGAIGAALATAAAVCRRIQRRRRADSRLLKATLAGLVAIGAGGAFVSHTRVAAASVSLALGFDDLVRAAGAAAIVTPIKQTSVWENGRIRTYASVRVDTPIAGTVAQDAWIRLEGGVVGNITQIVEGQPAFVTGQPSLVFVVPIQGDATTSRPPVFEIVGRGQGQYSLQFDEEGHTLWVAKQASSPLPLAPEPLSGRPPLPRAPVGLQSNLSTPALEGQRAEDVARRIRTAWARLHS